jgi:hypothetical protein
MLTTVDGRAEMMSTDAVEYLGYRIGLGHVGIKTQSIDKIKQRIGTLIYWTLINEPSHKTQRLTRLSSQVDQDYVSLVWRLRRYLYGDLSEKAVRRYQRGDVPLRRFKGVMSAYPLADDHADLIALDEWILTQVWLALRLRARSLACLCRSENSASSSTRTVTTGAAFAHCRERENGCRYRSHRSERPSDCPGTGAGGRAPRRECYRTLPALRLLMACASRSRHQRQSEIRDVRALYSES